MTPETWAIKGQREEVVSARGKRKELAPLCHPGGVKGPGTHGNDEPCKLSHQTGAKDQLEGRQSKTNQRPKLVGGGETCRLVMGEKPPWGYRADSVNL